MIGKNKEGVLYYSIRYKDAMGKTVQKTVQDKNWKTKKDVRCAMDQFLSTVKHSVEKMTVDQLYSIYKDEHSSKIKLRSTDTHEKLYRVHIKPMLGQMVIKYISPRDIAKWQAYIVSKKFSNNYSSAIQQLFRTLINYGLKYGYITTDPFRQEFVVNHTEQKKKMDYWTTEEFEQFILKVDDPIYEAAFTVLYWCGLRKGEMMALKISDVDFNNSTIMVNKTFDFVNHVTTTPKTVNSIRPVSMLLGTKTVLKELIDGYKQSPIYDGDGLLFGYDKHITASTLQRKMKEACDRSNIKLIRVHDLRHSHVSLLISMGFRDFAIAKRMGHTVAMVNETYGHWMQSSQEEMILKLEEKQENVKNLLRAKLVN